MTTLLDHMTTLLGHMTTMLGHMTTMLGHMTTMLGHMTTIWVTIVCSYEISTVSVTVLCRDYFTAYFDHIIQERIRTGG